MGIIITLEGERGDEEKTLTDPSLLLNGLLPEASDRSFRCLGFVDEYGNAIFNRLQMPDLIAELERVAGGADSEQRALLTRILELARECRDQVHLYVRFRGD